MMIRVVSDRTLKLSGDESENLYKLKQHFTSTLYSERGSIQRPDYSPLESDNLNWQENVDKKLSLSN